MDLSNLLGISKSKVIAIVGSGGKTSLMTRLGWEFAKSGNRVVLTTTTKIFPPKEGDSIGGIVSDDSLAKIGASFQAGRPLYIYSQEENGKWLGPPESLLRKISDYAIADFIIFEADGSRGKPLKFPGTHEPVIPEDFVDQVVFVFGALGLGRPFGKDVFHRPELALKYLGLAMGDIIEPNLLRDILRHPEGYGKISRNGAGCIVINQVDTQEIENRALLAGRCIKEAGFSGPVVLSSIQNHQWQLLI